MKYQTLFEEDRKKAHEIAGIIAKDLSRHYSIAELCDMTFVNPFKLKEIFGATFGKGPYQYLSDLRLDKAKTMLLQGSSLRRISTYIGFHGEYAETNFIRFFKRKTGITPHQWKHQDQKLTG